MCVWVWVCGCGCGCGCHDIICMCEVGVRVYIHCMYVCTYTHVHRVLCVVIWVYAIINWCLDYSVTRNDTFNIELIDSKMVTRNTG